MLRDVIEQPAKVVRLRTAGDGLRPPDRAGPKSFMATTRATKECAFAVVQAHVPVMARGSRPSNGRAKQGRRPADQTGTESYRAEMAPRTAGSRRLSAPRLPNS